MPDILESEERQALSQLDAYVSLMDSLAAADGAGREAIHARVSQDYAREPSDINKLYLAVVLSTPDHMHTDLPRADQLLKSLEESGDALPPVTAALVRGRRATISVIRASQSQLTALTRENKSLRKELDAAEAKIKALAAIEQKIEATGVRPDASGGKR